MTIFNKLRTVIGTLFISFIISNSFLFSQALVAFDFAGSGVIDAYFVNTNFESPVTMERSSGITASSSVVKDRFYSLSWTTGATNIVNNEYIQFTISPKSNVASYSITGLNIQHERSNTGPNQFVVRSSKDGFANNIATFSLSGTNPMIKNLNFSLTNITTSLTFRIYAYGASSGSGAWGPGGASGDDIELLGSITATVPVELISFDLKKINNSNKLIWRTATEINASHFSIERSPDGKEFDEIGQVKAKGSNSEYEFDDNNPAPDVNYYRLKMVDLDGSFKHSKIISILGENSALKITPSVVTDFINIENADIQQNTRVEIFDMMGRLVKSIKLQGWENRIDIFDLSKGMYFLRIQSSHTITTHKFMKG